MNDRNPLFFILEIYKLFILKIQLTLQILMILVE